MQSHVLVIFNFLASIFIRCSLPSHESINNPQVSLYSDKYRIAGKFGGLAVYITTAKLKSVKISYYSHIPIWRFQSANILAIAILGSTAKIYFLPIFPAIRYIVIVSVFMLMERKLKKITI